MPWKIWLKVYHLKRWILVKWDQRDKKQCLRCGGFYAIGEGFWSGDYRHQDHSFWSWNTPPFLCNVCWSCRPDARKTIIKDQTFQDSIETFEDVYFERVHFTGGSPKFHDCTMVSSSVQGSKHIEALRVIGSEVIFRDLTFVLNRPDPSTRALDLRNSKVENITIKDVTIRNTEGTHPYTVKAPDTAVVRGKFKGFMS